MTIEVTPHGRHPIDKGNLADDSVQSQLRGTANNMFAVANGAVSPPVTLTGSYRIFAVNDCRVRSGLADNGSALANATGGAFMRGGTSEIFWLRSGETIACDAATAVDVRVGQVGGNSAVVTAALLRPADTLAYAVGDLIANSTAAAAVNAAPIALAAARVAGGTGRVMRCRLSTTKTGLAGTEAFRIHLFKTAPTVDNGDNGALIFNGIAAIHLGIFDVVLDRVFKDGAKGIAAPAVGSFITFDAAAGSTNLYCLIEARNAYQPISGESFTIALEVDRD